MDMGERDGSIGSFRIDGRPPSVADPNRQKFSELNRWHDDVINKEALCLSFLRLYPMLHLLDGRNQDVARTPSPTLGVGNCEF